MKNYISIILILISLILASQTAAQTKYIWGKQFGTQSGDVATSIRCDKYGNIIIAGLTGGTFCGKNHGGSDCFIVKYDSLLNIIWQDQFGTSLNERDLKIETDKNGNYYIIGTTNGIVEGQQFGKKDIFIYKYDAAGNQLEQKILGSPQDDNVRGIYLDDASNIFIYGETAGKLGKQNFGDLDCFVMKLDTSLKEIFTFQFGTDSTDVCLDLSIDDSSNMYFSGFTKGNLSQQNKGNIDAFISKFSPKKELIWSKQFGTEENDILSKIIVDSHENIYAAGTSQSNFAGSHQGEDDIIYMKLDNTGNVLWQKQFGTNSIDNPWNLQEVNLQNGSIIMSGAIDHPFKRPFFRLYDTDGNVVWNQYFGTINRKTGADPRDIFITPNNNLYMCGFIWKSDLFSQDFGRGDAFVAKFNLNTDTNNPLIVKNKIDDKTIYSNSSFNFSLPSKHIFSTIENDTIYYEAKIKVENNKGNWIEPNSTTLTFTGSPEFEGIYNDFAFQNVIINDNKKLPEWLHFNSTTLKFSGIAESEDEFTVLIIARNKTKYVITDEFKMTVKK